MRALGRFILGAFEAVFGIVTAAMISMLTGTIGFWLWNFVGPEYFSFLPQKYLTIPWWHMVVLTYFVSYVGSLFRGYSTDANKTA